jgi:hypothetical protein
MFEIFLYLFVLVFVFWFTGSCPSRGEVIVNPLETAWFIGELFEVTEPDDCQWQTLTAAQLRSLCKLYNVPCSKRGKVNSRTIAQLMEVA